MKTPKRIDRYIKTNFNEVKHTTLNPDGPGVVRIHLIPPQYDSGEIKGSVAIINGQDIIPINVTWALILSELIDEVNRYHGRPISDADTKDIIEATVDGVKEVYRFAFKRVIRKDINKIMTTLKQIAYGESPAEEIGYMNIGEYAPYMRAPHRMDLMVSAMTKEGKWNCNQKCVHCYAAGQKLADEKELGTQEWIKVINKCRKIGIPQITFTGGEPTMREDLIELIDHAKWFVTRLNTNGIKLTKEYCKELYDASLDSAQITFYSFDKEIHNKLVGADQYDRTVAGIENALAQGLNISINTPLCTLNKDYVKTLEFLREKGVTYVTCSGLIITGNATKEDSESLQLSREEITGILADAVDYCNKNDMEISFTSPGWVDEEFFYEREMNPPTCGACLSNMAVTPSGNVVPCQSWLSDEPLGNILKNDWEKIWYNPVTMNRRDFSSMMTGTCPFRKSIDEKGEVR